MADNLSPENRRKNMVAIKSKDTKPEVFFRKALFHKGYRYRVHTNLVPGHPDIWLKKYNTAIFVHGCFWHRHQNCKYASMPKTNESFWDTKFNNNVCRDLRIKKELFEKGIKCLIVWECTIKRMHSNPGFEEKSIERIIDFMNSSEMYYEL